MMGVWNGVLVAAVRVILGSERRRYGILWCWVTILGDQTIAIARVI
jgi:hypothetical protein